MKKNCIDITIKIALIEKPEIGKITIKKVLFEGTDPIELVLLPLEATVTRIWIIPEFIDTKIILLDTPRQKLQMLLKDEEDQNYSFGNTNSIICILDYLTWIDHSEDEVEDSGCIYDIKKKIEFEVYIVLFLHKVDLILAIKIGFKLEIIRKQITKYLSLLEKLLLYFKNLLSNLIYINFNAMSKIISDYSEDILTLKKLIKNSIKNLSKTICFISSKEDDTIIFQSFSYDFDNTLIYYSYEQIFKLTKLTKINSLSTNLINSDSKILYFVIENISGFYSNNKNIIPFSKASRENELLNYFDYLMKDISLEKN